MAMDGMVSNNFASSNIPHMPVNYVPKINRPLSSSPGSLTSDTSNNSPNTNFYSPLNSTLQSPTSTKNTAQTSPNEMVYDKNRNFQVIPNSIENNFFRQNSFAYDKNNENLSVSNKNLTETSKANHNLFEKTQNNVYFPVANDSLENNFSFGRQQFLPEDEANYYSANPNSNYLKNFLSCNSVNNPSQVFYDDLVRPTSQNTPEGKRCFDSLQASFSQYPQSNIQFDSIYFPKKARLLEG